MTAYWTKQIQNLIDLTKDRIRRLEIGETLTGIGGASNADATQQAIENERAIIALLQQTIDALNAVIPNCRPNASLRHAQTIIANSAGRGRVAATRGTRILVLARNQNRFEAVAYVRRVAEQPAPRLLRL